MKPKFSTFLVHCLFGHANMAMMKNPMDRKHSKREQQQRQSHHEIALEPKKVRI